MHIDDSIPVNQKIWGNNKNLCCCCCCLLCENLWCNTSSLVSTWYLHILSWHTYILLLLLIFSYSCQQKIWYIRKNCAALAVWEFLMVQHLHGKSIVHPLLAHACMLILLLLSTQQYDTTTTRTAHCLLCENFWWCSNCMIISGGASSHADSTPANPTILWYHNNKNCTLLAVW
jgi:hypothetical protein